MIAIALRGVLMFVVVAAMMSGGACLPPGAPSPQGPPPDTPDVIDVDRIPGAVCEIADAATDVFTGDSDDDLVDFVCGFIRKDAAPLALQSSAGTAAARAAPMPERFVYQVRRQRAAAFAEAHRRKD